MTEEITIESIKKELSHLQFVNERFSYYIGNFYIIRMYLHPRDESLKLTTASYTLRVHHLNTLNIYLYCRAKPDHSLDVLDISSFINYKPIQYEELIWRNSGEDMPIENICHLIFYLHKLVKLQAFT